MKTLRICLTSLAAITACGGARAYSPLMFANGISARNVIAIQQSITTRAFQSFEGSAAAALGRRAKLALPEIFGDISPASRHDNSAKYGTMPMYGEYGDDGTVFTGRSGGDAHTVTIPVMNNVWSTWQHYGDTAKLNNMPKTDSVYDLIMVGISGRREQVRGGVSEWGMFGGYVGGTQENNHIEMHENGGYVGIYNGYKINELGLSVALDAGAIYNTAETTSGAGDEYANMWLGAAINARYNFRITEIFTLQPGIYGGYTWINSANYISAAGAAAENHNFNTFTVAPTLRTIVLLARGWYGTAEARYVANFINSGDAYANGVKLPELGDKNYIEYGIGIEKSIDRFNISVNLGRRDGGRAGWNGGMSFKYLF